MGNQNNKLKKSNTKNISHYKNKENNGNMMFKKSIKWNKYT